ncbi:thioredoxin family protein [Pedobacter immunditicola]|uniref:thioredoxin family protein n=1 Tax=Pedobacter immunditicola TaxID=3133440 RepID=UPI0030B2C6B4
MKRYLMTVLLLATGIMAIAQTTGYKPGDLAANFSLKNIDQKSVSLNDYKNAKGFIVIFTCNTCPVSQAYEERINALQDRYGPQGYPVIAINPNDPEVSAGDSYKAMQERAKAKNYSFVYLFDPGQVVSKQFGAQRTPHVYLLNKTPEGNKVAYIGAIDNDTENTKPEKIKYVEQAVDALLAGSQPPLAYTKAIGCSVKSKKQL